MLAMCVARGAFRDYSTLDEILEIPPPLKKEMYPLQWQGGMLNPPYFDSPIREIQKANLFSG